MTGRPPLYTTTANLPRHLGGIHENDDTYSGIGDDVDDDFEDQMQYLKNDTPSRATSLPVPNPRPQNTGKAPVTKAVRIARQDDRDSSPLPDVLPNLQQPPAIFAAAQAQKQYSSLTRHNEYKQQVDAIPPPQERPIHSRAPENAVSKVSGYHEASEEEQPTDPKMGHDAGTNKRSHAEIDYDLNDLNELNGKAYADLDKVPFLTDPRVPAVDAGVGSQDTPLSIPQRLAPLSKMRPEDQEGLFRTLNDEENEEVGQWFVHKFQDDLKKLMERRLERRKIALKYEAEARRREKVVQVKIGDVEDEMRQLRKGGGDLIQGRSVAGVGGTPKKK
jgi:Extracellular mutant protein 11